VTSDVSLGGSFAGGDALLGGILKDS
jgi:hypothetical protein